MQNILTSEHSFVNVSPSTTVSRFNELNDLLENLVNLGCMHEIIKQLVEEKTEICNLIRKCLEKNVIKCFLSPRSTLSIELVFMLIPDWKERLMKWTKYQIQIDKKNNRQFGEKLTHNKVIQLYSTLIQRGLLKEFIESLKQNGSRELTRDLENIYNAFLGNGVKGRQKKCHCKVM